MTADLVPRPKLKAPFPWFGGKSRCAPQVWEALGDVSLYVEPFAGSLAVLLGRPESHRRSMEVVNDKDDLVVNFWRAVQHDPEAVAHWADWPVTEADLFARHMWLVRNKEELANSIRADPEFFDAKVAGWWAWGLSCWIGGGWCSGDGPWQVVDGRVVRTKDVPGAGSGLPSVAGPQGVPSQRPSLGGLRGTSSNGGVLVPWFEALQERLRRVIITSGDWTRTVTEGATDYGASVGIFLDPPYSGDVRANDLYAVEDHDVAAEVRDWAIEHGEDRRLRIVLAGFDLEHDDVVPPTWRRVRWLPKASYQSAAFSVAGTGNAENRKREVLWCSPGCLNPRPTLFE